MASTAFIEYWTNAAFADFDNGDGTWLNTNKTRFTAVDGLEKDREVIREQVGSVTKASIIWYLMCGFELRLKPYNGVYSIQYVGNELIINEFVPDNQWKPFEPHKVLDSQPDVVVYWENGKVTRNGF